MNIIIIGSSGKETTWLYSKLDKDGYSKVKVINNHYGRLLNGKVIFSFHDEDLNAPALGHILKHLKPLKGIRLHNVETAFPIAADFLSMEIFYEWMRSNL